MAENTLDTRLAVVEQRMDHVDASVSDLRTDVRELRRSLDTKFLWLLGVQLGTSAAIIGTIAKAHGWL